MPRALFVLMAVAFFDLTAFKAPPRPAEGGTKPKDTPAKQKSKKKKRRRRGGAEVLGWRDASGASQLGC